MPTYYSAPLGVFLQTSPTEVVGELALANSRSQFQLPPEQIEAWRLQLPPLAEAMKCLAQRFSSAQTWQILLEYPIPRVGKRIDCVVLAHDVILVLEAKTGVEEGGAARQVDDYACNLAYFHEASDGRTIIPIVVSNKVTNRRARRDHPSGVRATHFSTHATLPELLVELCCEYIDPTSSPIDPDKWNHARFKPVPPIIDAAVALYAGMNVFEIGHACAADESLAKTTSAIVAAAETARSNREKLICFVTGVPGAGKTLVGLNAVHHSGIRKDASFLSGNGPLVKVLRAALVRDVLQRARSQKIRLTQTAARQQVQTFIHNVHRFAEEFYQKHSGPPAQNVIVFDEAQRAWDAKENHRRYGRDISEPAMILEIMNRHPDWAVIVALVGGGQEIHDGEAGLSEWGRAVQLFPNWRILASEEVFTGGTSVAGFKLFDGVQNTVSLTAEPAFHLPVSLRSIKSHAAPIGRMQYFSAMPLRHCRAPRREYLSSPAISVPQRSGCGKFASETQIAVWLAAHLQPVCVLTAWSHRLSFIVVLIGITGFSIPTKMFVHAPALRFLRHSSRFRVSNWIGSPCAGVTILCGRATLGRASDSITAFGGPV